MITADIHTHTTFSADGISGIKEMIEYAIQRKLEIYGISEHFNYDYDRPLCHQCQKPLRKFALW